MQLSNEDNLRLNVLLAQTLLAIRINEATMTVYALTEKGEAKVQLNPTVRDEQYLRWVRELLSMKITGSPGGYPIFMKRWTRMGHTHNTLEHMLLLGEPEAVVAVVHSQEISHDIGKRAWWANPTTEVARRLLEYPDVAQGALGQEIADYLMEFLPFEEVQLHVVTTVRLCLQGELISEAEKEKLWTRAKRKNPYYVGFLHADTQNIPLEQEHSPAFEACQKAFTHAGINTQADIAHNLYAEALLSTLSADGQKWLITLQNALRKPVDQDVVIALFKAIEQRFNLPFDERRGVRDIEVAQQRASAYCQSNECPHDLTMVKAVLNSEQIKQLEALLLVAQLGEDTLIPIFGGNDSVGSVMRRRMEPVTQPLLAAIQTLLG